MNIQSRNAIAETEYRVMTKEFGSGGFTYSPKPTIGWTGCFRLHNEDFKH